MKIITYKDFKNIIKVVSNCLIVVLLTNILSTSIPAKAGSQYYLADFYSVTLQTLNKMGVITDDYFLYDNCWWFMTYYPLSDHDFDNITTDVKTFLVWSITEHYFYLNDVNDRYYYDDKWNDDHCVVNDIDSDAFRNAINRGLNGRPVSNNTVSENQPVSADVIDENISLSFRIENYNNVPTLALYFKYPNQSNYKLVGYLFESLNSGNMSIIRQDSYYNTLFGKFDNLTGYNTAFYFRYENGNYYYPGMSLNAKAVVYNFSKTYSLSCNVYTSYFSGVKGCYFGEVSSLSGLSSFNVTGGYCYNQDNNKIQAYNYRDGLFSKYQNPSSGMTKDFYYDTFNSETGLFDYSGSVYSNFYNQSNPIYFFGDSVFFTPERTYFFKSGQLYDLGQLDAPFDFVFNPPGSTSQNTPSQNNTTYNFISVENTITEIVNNYYYTYNTVSGDSSSYDDTNLLSILRQMNNKLDLILNRLMKLGSSGGNFTINDISLSIETSINNVFNTLFVLNEDQQADIDSKLATLKSPFNWIFTFVDGFKGFINEFKSRSAVYSSGYSIGNEYTDYFTTSGNSASLNMAYNGDINSGGNNIVRSSALVAPVIMAHFDNSTSDIFQVGDVVILDLSWYIPYKATVDQIIVLFCWVFFIWRLFKTIPSLLSGGDGYISAIEPSIRQNNIKNRGV